MDEIDLELDELKRQLEEVNEKLNTLVQESLYTNALLKAILHANNAVAHTLPENYDDLVDKNFIIIYDTFEPVLDFSKMIAVTKNSNLVTVQNEPTHDFMFALTGCNDNDYILIPNTVLIKNPEIEEQIINVFDTGSIELPLGKGPSARRITIDIPKLYFIIYTDSEELLSSRIRKKFFVAN